MNHDHATGQARSLALYLTTEHACSYLDGLLARTLFVDPTADLDSATYQILLERGFRRSGAHVYRPACRQCSRCIPVRLPVASFTPDRSQRRNWQRNAPDIAIVETPVLFNPEHFALYQRYLAHRHADGSMADDLSEESYRRFLIDPWGGTTRFIELRLDERLLGVAVTDVLEQGLSAVYTFFDPDLAARAPGTFAVLAQIESARQLGLPFLYLGYWIQECQKMAYKSRFRPLESWDGSRWQRIKQIAPVCSD